MLLASCWCYLYICPWLKINSTATLIERWNLSIIFADQNLTRGAQHISSFSLNLFFTETPSFTNLGFVFSLRYDCLTLHLSRSRILLTLFYHQVISHFQATFFLIDWL
ncbi:unnamed protein product [Musa textilis]